MLQESGYSTETTIESCSPRGPSGTVDVMRWGLGPSRLCLLGRTGGLLAVGEPRASSSTPTHGWQTPTAMETSDSMAAWFRQAAGKMEVWLGFAGFREEGGDKKRGGGVMCRCALGSTSGRPRCASACSHRRVEEEGERVASLLRGSCGLRERLWSGALLAKSRGGIL
jgi:hypothetical protein